jgi:hypothetical protein
MQSEAEAVRAAESCVLGAAERHMNAQEPCGGKCWECDHFHEVQASDVLSAGLRRQLAFCGACVVDGSVTIVDRSEEHSADECWEVH